MERNTIINRMIIKIDEKVVDIVVVLKRIEACAAHSFLKTYSSPQLWCKMPDGVCLTEFNG